MVVGMPVYSQM
jgi:hypothetical protein